MKIALFGYGKMGKEIEKIALERGHTISAKISRSYAKENLKPGDADAVIEFTSPEAAEENIRYCLENKIPVVIGTTGWYDQFDAITAQCRKENGAMLYATNFSLGVNLFFAVNKYLAKLMANHQEYTAVWLKFIIRKN